MTPVVHRHVGSVIDRLEGGWIARNAGQGDRITALHADCQTDRPFSLNCRRGRGRRRGRRLGLGFLTAKKCASEKSGRGIALECCHGGPASSFVECSLSNGPG